MDKFLFERLVAESGSTQRLTGVGRVFSDKQLERLMGLMAEEAAKAVEERLAGETDHITRADLQQAADAIRAKFKEPT